MMEVIDTAGLEAALSGAKQSNPRKDRLKAIVDRLFREGATPDEREDAIDAIVEMSKE